MNRDFLSNFERPPKKSDAPKTEAMAVQDAVEIAEDTYIRNLCFVWPDGRRQFLSYSRLDSGEISAEHDVMRLYFGGDVAELVGFGLLPLFSSVMEHEVRFIYCEDARYNEINLNEAVVNEIVVHTT